MKKRLIALGVSLAICLPMLATDMVVKQKNGEVKRFNVEDVEEVIFNENAIIPNDSIVADTSETPLTFSVTSDSTVEVTGSKKKLDSIEIPSKVKIDGNLYTVNSIGSKAFKDDSLTSVKIPSSVTKIDYNAFNGCKVLTSIDIPSSVTDIKGSAFANCSKLTSINVATDNAKFTSVDGILYSKDKTEIVAFPGGIIKDTFSIPSTVTSIKDCAFMGCEIERIEVPSSVTTIGDGAFWNCNFIVIDNLAKNVTVGEYAFANCTHIIYTQETSVIAGNPDLSVVMDTADIKNLTFVTLSDSTAKVMYGTADIDSLFIPARIKIGEKIYTVTSIGDHAFDFIEGNLIGVKIPSTITRIGENAFYGSYIDEIEIPSSVTEIGKEAFADCRLLKKVVIDNSKDNVEVGENAFDGCKSVTWLKE